MILCGKIPMKMTFDFDPFLPCVKWVSVTLKYFNGCFFIHTQVPQIQAFYEKHILVQHHVNGFKKTAHVANEIMNYFPSVGCKLPLLCQKWKTYCILWFIHERVLQSQHIKGSHKAWIWRLLCFPLLHLDYNNHSQKIYTDNRTCS